MVSDTIKIEAEIQRERGVPMYHGTEYWDCTKKKKGFCDSKRKK